MMPESFSPVQEQLTSTNTAFPATLNHNRVYDLYVYDSTDDSTTNYDRVVIVDSVAGRMAQIPSPISRPGIGPTSRSRSTGPSPARPVVSSSRRSRSRPTCRSSASTSRRSPAQRDPQRAGRGRSAAFEETLNAEFPSSTAADFAPSGGIIDEDTYVEQGLFWADAHWATSVHHRGRSGRSTANDRWTRGRARPAAGRQPRDR